MAHLELEKVKDVSAFRKIAIGTWRTTYDPSVYGTMELPMDAADDYLQRFREQTGLRVTFSHLMARAIAAALIRIPDANAILRFHSIYRRKRVGVFFQVAMTDEGDDKVDLSGATIYDVEQKDLATIVQEFQDKVDVVRKRADPSLEKTRKSFQRVPGWLVHRLLKIVSFFQYTMNWALPGVPKDPFGSIMITNIGSLGLDMAYAPLVPYSRVPMVLAMGAVKEVPVVEDGRIVIRKRMKVNATFDHRFIDGYHAGVIARLLTKWFTEPEKYFGPIPAGKQGVAALDAPAGVSLPAPAATPAAAPISATEATPGDPGK